MTKLPYLRLIVDPAANSGARNMAVDEALLNSAVDDGIATLRWYRWREPTVSFGYFQRESDLISDPRLAALPRVRRLSGGGTLVHHYELTYSLALPPAQRVVERPPELYLLVHRAVAKVFCGRGIAVELRGLTVKRSKEPVLCFSREDEHDLVHQGHKILGSAQRRRRGAILQHGGLLLKASPITPELPGILDLCDRAEMTDLTEELAQAILREIAEVWREEPLTDREIEAVNRLACH